MSKQSYDGKIETNFIIFPLQMKVSESLILQRKSLIKELTSSFKWRIMIKDGKRKGSTLGPLPESNLEIEQEKWIELLNEKKKQLQSILMQIDAWRSRYTNTIISGRFRNFYEKSPFFQFSSALPEEFSISVQFYLCSKLLNKLKKVAQN